MKKIIVPVLLLLSFAAANAQTDTLQFYVDGEVKKTDEKKASYYRVAIRQDSYWQVFDLFLLTNKIQMKGFYTDDSLKMKEGPFEYFHSSGKINGKGSYKNGRMTGIWKWWYKDGSLKDSAFYKNGMPSGESIGWYENGSIMSLRNFDTTGKGNGYSEHFYLSGTLRDSGRCENNKRNGNWVFYRTDQTKASEVRFEKDSVESYVNYDTKGNVQVNIITEVEAHYKDGDAAWNNYLSKRLSKLYNLRNAAAYEGFCNIQFVVDIDGRPINVEALDHNNSLLAGFVISIIEDSKKWIPAIQFNLPVKAWRRQRFTFKLQ